MSTSKLTNRGELTASLVGIAVVIAISGAGALWTRGILADIPGQVARGWGMDGHVDAFIDPGVIWGLGLGLSLGIPLLLVLLGLLLRLGRILTPVAGGVAALLAIIFGGVLSLQRGMTEEQIQASAPSPLPLAFLAMLVAILVGAGLALALRRRPGEREVPVALCDSDPRLAVNDGVRVAWTGQARVSRGLWVALISGIAVAFIAVVCWLLINLSWEPVAMMAFLLLVFVSVGVSMAARVTIDSRGVRVRGAGLFPYTTIPLSEISGASVVHVDPLRDFYGWGGTRFNIRGAAGFITSRGEAIRIDRGSSEGSFTVTVDDAETAVTVVNTLLLRRASHA